MERRTAPSRQDAKARLRLRYRFDGLLPRPPPEGLPVRLGQLGFVGFEGFEVWVFKVRMAVLLES